MADQLSLFPVEALPPEETPGSGGEVTALDEMFAARKGFRNRERYLRMLSTIARFPQYSPFNGLLLHTQKPDVSTVATAGTWARRYKRNLRADARPLIILAPMSPVNFVFDVDATEGEPIARELPARPVFDGRQARGVWEKTVKNGMLHGISVRHGQAVEPAALSLTYNIRKQYREMNLDARSTYLVFVEENAAMADRFATLAYGLAHIFCGHLGIDHLAWWPDRRGVAQRQAELEVRSVGYLVCGRRGLTAHAEAFFQSGAAADTVYPPISLSAVFHATQYIEEMGKSLWSAPRKKSRYGTG